MTLAGFRLFLFCFVLIAASLDKAALAVEVSAVDEAKTAAVKNDLFEPTPAKDWNATLGARSRISSTKIGGKSSSVVASPFYDIQWKDVAFLSSDRGLGVNLLRAKDVVTASDKLFVGFALNVDSEKTLIRSQMQFRSLDLKGKYIPFLLSFAEYKIENLRIYSEIASFIDRNNGNVFTVGSEYALQLTNKWTLILGCSVSYGDTTHMRENFGVPSVFAASVGRSAFRLHNGFRDATLTAEADYQASRYWSYSVSGGYTRLLGEAAESYRVETPSQPFMAVGVKYHF